MKDCNAKINEGLKDSSISLRLKTEEKKIVEQNSRELKLNMTDYIRYCILVAEPNKLKEKLLTVYKNKYLNAIKNNSIYCEDTGLKKTIIGSSIMYYHSVICNEEINSTENSYKLKFDFFINNTLSTSIVYKVF